MTEGRANPALFLFMQSIIPQMNRRQRRRCLHLALAWRAWKVEVQPDRIRWRHLSNLANDEQLDRLYEIVSEWQDLAYQVKHAHKFDLMPARRGSTLDPTALPARVA